MKALVIGADGFIGSRLLRVLRSESHRTICTTRRSVTAQLPECYVLDLLNPDVSALTDVDVAYLCAGISGFRECEGNPEAYRVNVDGTIAVAKLLLQRGVFVVFLSSDAVEWGINCAYAHHKALVEMFLHSSDDTAIVRAGKVTEATVDAFVHILVDVGVGKMNGIIRWKREPQYA